MSRLELQGISHRYGRGEPTVLDEVDLAVADGGMVAVVGPSGTGKSTLLRIAAGVVAPTSGTVAVGGRVAGILSLGDGFHPLLTGRENAFTAAMLSGMSRADVRRRLPQVLEFSELGDAVDEPVRTYSAGMFVRLAYAVAAHVDADLLLVDEALAVGDLAFASKCLDHLERLRARGTTVLLASHDLDVVRRTCDRVAWIHRGELRAVGDPLATVEEYQRASHAATLARTSDERAAAGRLGTGEVDLEVLAVHDGHGRPVEVLATGGALVVELGASSRGVTAAEVSVSLHDRAGDTVVDVHHGVVLDPGGPARRITVRFDRLDLAAGTYGLDVGVHAPEFEFAHDYRWEAALLEVVGPSSPLAFAPPTTWRAD